MEPGRRGHQPRNHRILARRHRRGEGRRLLHAVPRLFDVEPAVGAEVVRVELAVEVKLAEVLVGLAEKQFDGQIFGVVVVVGEHLFLHETKLRDSGGNTQLKGMQIHCVPGFAINWHLLLAG